MSMFATIVSALLLAAAAEEAADGPEVIKLTAFKIVVRAGSTPETAVAVQQIAVNDKLRDAFGDSPIDWDPTEFLDRATLRSTTSDATIAVGRKGKAPVYVVFTRPHLKVGEPAELRIGVEKPQDLPPGIYRGELASRFSSPKVGASLEYRWPIELTVVGRRLVSVAYNAKALHVGSPSDLTVTMETVGCEPGEGSLEVDWWRGEQKPDRLLRAKLPLPEPIDPAVSSSLVECHPRWRDEVLFAPMRVVNDAGGGPEPALQRHEIDVQLPHCPATGFMQAKLSWSEAKESANPAALAIESKATPIGPGILAWPLAPAVGERVRIDACSEQNLGDELTLEVHPGDGPMEEVVLTPLRADAEGGSGPFEYRGYFQPAAPGAYRIAAVAESEAAAALPDSLMVLAYFQYGSRMGADSPLTVFAGPAPFWWTTLNGPAPSWEASQPQAFLFGDATGTLSRMRLKSSGIFQRKNGEWSPLDPKNDPEIKLTSTLPAAAGGNAWDLANHEKTTFGVDVSLLPVEPVDQPRHAIGPRQCWARMIVDARDTKGEPLQRIVVFPFKVDVDTAETGNLMGVAALVGILLIVALIVLLAWRASGGRGHKRPALAAAAEAPADGSLLGEVKAEGRRQKAEGGTRKAEGTEQLDDDVEPIL